MRRTSKSRNSRSARLRTTPVCSGHGFAGRLACGDGRGCRSMRLAAIVTTESDAISEMVHSRTVSLFIDGRGCRSMPQASIPYCIGLHARYTRSVRQARWLAAAVRRITIVLTEQMRSVSSSVWQRRRCLSTASPAVQCPQSALACSMAAVGQCPATTWNSGRLRQWAVFGLGLLDVARDPAGAFVAVPWPLRLSGR
jgi:hypothetical protein